MNLAVNVTTCPPPSALDVPPHTYAVEILHLVNCMLQKNPELRPTTAEIICVPFVYNYIKTLTSRWVAYPTYNTPTTRYALKGAFANKFFFSIAKCSILCYFATDTWSWIILTKPWTSSKGSFASCQRRLHLCKQQICVAKKVRALIV